MTRSAVRLSAMSPLTVSKSDWSDGPIERAVPTTA
jgi:hypothetical protein